MADAVFVSSLGMVISMGGIMAGCALGGLVLFLFEKAAGKKRIEAH